MIDLSDFKNEYELKEHIRKVVNATKEAGKIIVATGDVHHFNKEDKVYVPKNVKKQLEFFRGFGVKELIITFFDYQLLLIPSFSLYQKYKLKKQ